MDDLTSLKERRAAVILAHNYQPDAVQDAADHVGDSFELSLLASRTEAEVVVFCGVHFMAEAAAILSPRKIILLPDLQAGCPLAESVAADEVRALRAVHPGAAVVAYVNTTAAVKAESDVCVTSANAEAVVSALPQEEIIFVPDPNLGRHIAARTGKRVITHGGGCPAHRVVSVEDIRRARRDHPQAVVMVHPEVPPETAVLADLVLGTGGMVRAARERSEEEFVVGTEAGMLYRLRKENPEKTFHLLTPALWCPDMKHTTLEKITRALHRLSPRIEVPADVAARARTALERMLEFSGGGEGGGGR